MKSIIKIQLNQSSRLPIDAIGPQDHLKDTALEGTNASPRIIQIALVTNLA
jgi:hypothetical protein